MYQSEWRMKPSANYQYNNNKHDHNDASGPFRAVSARVINMLNSTFIERGGSICSQTPKSFAPSRNARIFTRRFEHMGLRQLPFASDYVVGAHTDVIQASMRSSSVYRTLRYHFCCSALLTPPRERWDAIYECLIASSSKVLLN